MRQVAPALLLVRGAACVANGKLTVAHGKLHLPTSCFRVGSDLTLEIIAEIVTRYKYTSKLLYAIIIVRHLVKVRKAM